MTTLDAAYAAMDAAPEDDAARLRFFAQLVDMPLLLLLDREPEGDSLVPRLFPLEDGPVVLVFDADDRMAAFCGAPAPYVEIPGRVIAALLAGKGLGLGLNLGVAPSSYLMPPEALDWLAAMLAQGPVMAEARPHGFHPPVGLPEGLITALDARLARAGRLASSVLLSGVTWEGGRRGHLLAFVDAAPGAEPSLARAAAEALTFSGVEAGEMDVVFLAETNPVLAPLARVALRFDLPEAAMMPDSLPAPTAPGSDPSRPPRLR